MSLGVTKSDVFVAPGFYNKHQLLTAVSEQNKMAHIFLTRVLGVLIFLSFLNSGCKKKGAHGNEGPATSMAKVTSVTG